MNPVSICTIKELIPVFKNNEEANLIQLATFEEHGYALIVGKNLHKVGSKGIFIMPDYCVPLMELDGINSPNKILFKEYTMPNNDPKKCRLGKNGRIRALKFNFSLKDSIDPIYSMGILLPIKESNEILGINLLEIDPEILMDTLGVFKYEEPETAYSGLSKGELPLGMYSTDETNIETILNILTWPMQLIGSLKVDGSSLTIYYKNDEQNGICSRKLEKKLDQILITGYTDANGNKVRKHFDRETETKGWLIESTELFYIEPQSDWNEIHKIVSDTFVDLGNPILQKLKVYCKENNLQLAIRGEICGSGLKGSGNKHNPHAALKQQFLSYGVDDYSSDKTKKVDNKTYCKVVNDLGLTACEQLFIKVFNSYEELLKECNNYFKENMVEGIVCRTLDSRHSFKIMNKEYDSKK